ncbi:DNA repair protein rhp26 [Friedmanniomyces endolithicus]|uniref:DNA repair protein rhp26 n=1 Tax=Friedmanniomyces endolithicus TaxID=329885 RepID=A0AAN6QQN3_9PEZI|nr:DNA repair protein rhp26 [Friedmanniomyces endolithicus]KAK0776960.1 DNA repair protein rhp26 [Friedmanniomyces endolithicus]KAK0796025.1 DNA repair protein rhp26 [Friedmanniomyces endolithicus]KAK0801122.1 DNA repair protein rhp26 [Friedmanniomyces endolithicus]KAK0917957.1 DNA repair protein rhp26 [Friedmanniomyces endolithicus]
MEEVTCAPDLASVAESTGLEIATSPVDRSEESQERQEEQSGEEGIAMNGDGEEKDEATVLAELATADQLLVEQADERDKKRLDKTQKSRELLQVQVRSLESRLAGFGNSVTKQKWRDELRNHQERIAELDGDREQIQKRIDERHSDAAGDGETLLEEAGNKRMQGESQRDFLIRTGKITPFSKMGGQLLRTSSSLGDVLLDAEEEGEGQDEPEAGEEQEAQANLMSHRNLLAPGFDQEDASTAATTPAADVEDDAAMARRLQDEEFASERPAKRRRLQSRRQGRAASAEVSSPPDDSDAYVSGLTEAGIAAIGQSGDEDEPEDEDVEGDLPLGTTPGLKRRKGKSVKRKLVDDDGEAEAEDVAGIDDGDEQVYQDRLESWVRRRRAARLKVKQRSGSTVAEDAGPADVKPEEAEAVELEDVSEAREEWHMPHPTRTDAEFEGGFRIPGDIYPSLFDYQKTGVQWLWELYSQQVGGIIGDEMGLGKTIQIISFLAGLHYSEKLDKPIIVVCPATVMKQWVNEFHRWWPPLRVSILHTSGSGMLDINREARNEDDLEMATYSRRSTTDQTKGHKAARRIVDRVIRDGHVLVTTYSGLQTYAELLIPTDWGYAVLDEGHKIRNPNTAITIFCKELRTHNRVILSGTPMQNNLTELWSLFDFVFPMRLGTLVNFRTQFEIPIKQGGYANASNLQVETAMKCAETLKDTISPYLLQRFKVDVAADLPKKSERVLFCKLTKLQRDAYEWFLASEDMRSILSGKRQALYGVDILRKICNHPDLVEHKTLSKKAGYTYGTGTKSGKMQVVKALLEIWKRNGHKTLLFAQHRIMLDILEIFIQGLPGDFNYRRMDGNTSIKDRQSLVDEFNRDPDLHVFLLTTKVGGLGINLTGADRVIIYDPDWNPSTDIQARERAWRLGQKREVEIYRLMTAGTIEEKIYHRQIFKQFLTNKILRDPGQRQTFQLRDLQDLFTLGESREGGTETGDIFKGTKVKLTSLPTPPEEDAEGRGTGAAAVGGIAGVSRLEDYRGDPDEDQQPTESTANDADSGSQNDRMLSSIFARTGVQSALEHDAIINGVGDGKKATRADPEIIAREARKVAAAAARELQRAGEIARTVPAGTPTWTGVVGTAGRPDLEPIGRRAGAGAGRGGRGGTRGGGMGLSSAAVIANLASRQHLGGGGGGAGDGPGTPSSRSSTPSRVTRPLPQRQEQQPKGKDFLVLIRDFLKAHDGKAHTQMLIDHFNRFCGTAQRTAEFKEMLKSIADLERGGRGRGRWVLKSEFR